MVPAMPRFHLLVPGAVMFFLAAFALAADLTPLAPGAFDQALPLPPAAVTALGERKHEEAASALKEVDLKRMSPEVADDFAFVLAWELVHAKRGAEAERLLDAVARAPTPPPDYVALLRGEVLVASGKPVDAITALEPVAAGESPIAIRARLVLADGFVKAGRDADARKVYESVAARPDPTPGNEKALGWLSTRIGATSKEAQPLVRRLYRYYPRSSEEITATASFTPTTEDRAWRADRLQERGQYADAVAVLKDVIEGSAEDDCVARFAWGRAQHKQNNLTLAAAMLDPLGKACRTKDPDRGAKALYLAGKSYERIKQSGSASRVYASIPEWYPEHSMADDGYTLGGIARQESGDLEGARKLWAIGMEKYPTGDLAGENGWRLAWGAWLAGDVKGAIEWADKAAAGLPLASSPTDVLASMYWAGRWRAWPKDNQLTSDVAARKEAADRLERVATLAPWHYYGGLAAAQLARLDPERAAKLPRMTVSKDDSPWLVPASFVSSRPGQAALALARLGLVREALAELEDAPELETDPALAAIRMLIDTRAGNFLVAHDRLRAWLKTRPPTTLGPNEGKVLRVAYPLNWWPEVQTATTKYRWDGRLFHALVREESNFNQKIVSHAGAKGLSQLMPGTAKVVAKQMGISYSAGQITDPATNLSIGSFYLDDLIKDHGGNPMLALASYNAGPGNTKRWLEALPANAPVDTWAETITFRETRHYVKRVTSTWLTYRMLYGDASPPGWDKFVVDAVPG
jgi:soluble lytic murein transglycosylase-like protein